MPNTLTGDSTGLADGDDAEISVPADGDPLNAASIETPGAFQTVANWAKYLFDFVSKTHTWALLQTFTSGLSTGDDIEMTGSYPAYDDVVVDKITPANMAKCWVVGHVIGSTVDIKAGVGIDDVTSDGSTFTVTFSAPFAASTVYDGYDGSTEEVWPYTGQVIDDPSHGIFDDDYHGVWKMVQISATQCQFYQMNPASGGHSSFGYYGWMFGIVIHGVQA